MLPRFLPQKEQETNGDNDGCSVRLVAKWQFFFKTKPKLLMTLTAFNLLPTVEFQNGCTLVIVGRGFALIKTRFAHKYFSCLTYMGGPNQMLSRKCCLCHSQLQPLSGLVSLEWQ